jgi:hypothetical protein
LEANYRVRIESSNDLLANVDRKVEKRRRELQAKGAQPPVFKNATVLGALQGGVIGTFGPSILLKKRISGQKSSVRIAYGLSQTVSTEWLEAWSKDCTLWTPQRLNSGPIRFNDLRRPRDAPCGPPGNLSANPTCAEYAVFVNRPASWSCGRRLF